MRATFHAREICLDFFIPLNLNEKLQSWFSSLWNFYSTSCYFLLIGSTHSPLHPTLEHPKKVSIPEYEIPIFTHTHIKQHQNYYIPMYKVVQIWQGLIRLVYTQISPGHIWTTLYIKQVATLHNLFISVNCSTCVGWYLHPSSGAHTSVSTASGTCQTVTATCRYSGR